MDWIYWIVTIKWRSQNYTNNTTQNIPIKLKSHPHNKVGSSPPKKIGYVRMRVRGGWAYGGIYMVVSTYPHARWCRYMWCGVPGGLVYSFKVLITFSPPILYILIYQTPSPPNTIINFETTKGYKIQRIAKGGSW